jgi:hypothetical protein
MAIRWAQADLAQDGDRDVFHRATDGRQRRRRRGTGQLPLRGQQARQAQKRHAATDQEIASEHLKPWPGQQRRCRKSACSDLIANYSQ